MIRSHLRHLFSESLVYGMAGVVARFLGILMVPVYTRIFLPEDYGIMSLITVTMSLMSIFVVLALDNSAHRWYWDSEDVQERKRTMASWTWCQLGMSFAVGLPVFVFADGLGYRIVGRWDMGPYFRLTAMALPLGVLGMVVTNWLRLQRKPWQTGFFALGTSLLTIVLTLVLVVALKLGLYGVYLAQLVGAAITTCVSVLLLWDWMNPLHFSYQRLREMLRYAMPLIPAALAFWIVGYTDRYFLQIFTDTRQVGLYQVGSSIAALMALITMGFQQAWGPFALSIHKEGEAKQVYAAVLLGFTWLTVAVGTGLALFAPEIVELVATAVYRDSARVVGVLVFGNIMMGLYYIAAIGLNICKTTKPIGVAVFFAALLNVILNLVLVPSWGLIGSATATMISQVALSVCVFRAAQRLYPVPYPFKAVTLLLALGMAAVGAGHFLDRFSLGTSIAVRLALVSLFLPLPFLPGVSRIVRS